MIFRFKKNLIEKSKQRLWLLIFFVERKIFRMKQIPEEELKLLKQTKQQLDQQLKKESLELEELKNEILEAKIRRIVLEELMNFYT